MHHQFPLNSKSRVVGASLSAAMALFAVGVSPTAANAALTCSGSSCTETITTTVTDSDFTNSVLTIDKWVSNPAPGFTQTLTSVELDFSTTITASGTLTNNGATSATGSFLLTGTDQYVLGSTLASGGPQNSNSPTVTLAAGASTPFSAT